MTILIRSKLPPKQDYKCEVLLKVLEALVLAMGASWSAIAKLPTAPVTKNAPAENGLLHLTLLHLTSLLSPQFAMKKKPLTMQVQLDTKSH